jgi:pyruvate dehydrogenase E2 component (dihydrolipoamide acetyltransferase)
VSDFLMPALGADMTDGTLVEWLIKPGDRVKRGDVVAVVETQKGAIEVEIFDEGIVSELVVPVGAQVAVGGLLARIGERSGAQPERASFVPPLPPAASPARPAPPKPAAVPPAACRVSSGAAKITPAARRRAAELSVDPAALAGTGVEGAVSVADVEAAARSRVAPQPAAPLPAAEAAPLAPTAPPRRAGFDPTLMRKAIAAAMGRSKREIPHYYLSHTVDLTAALAWLEAFNAAQQVPNRLLPAVLLLKVSALALREVPQLNGTYAEGVFQPGGGIHVGWAISLRGGGLVAPAIRDTDVRPLAELMAAMRDLVQRARTGGLRSSELGSPTVTVTSLGERGAESVTGIIYPPQVAIIGFGTVSSRPWVANGRVEARPLVTVSLAADHRVTDGHIGARLLSAIERLLQEPDKL